uniref:Uncharacterized protein n=1 Tax=viral metagenome TaxID=1070528 RepID=A0A6M3IN81_9ZZZZ
MKRIVLIALVIVALLMAGCGSEYHVIKCENGKYSYVKKWWDHQWQSSLEFETYEIAEKFVLGVMQIDRERRIIKKESCPIVEIFPAIE